jgi:hypothetical protein
MTSDNPADQQTALEQASDALTAAAADIAAMPQGDERARQVRAIATLLVGSPEEAREHAIRLCPDIGSAEPIPDTHLEPSELAMVSPLTATHLELIDRTLVANATQSWQSVARVVGYTLVDLKTALPGIPLGFYAQRVRALVHSGALLGRGDLGFIRLSEVRLPAPGEEAG